MTVLVADLEALERVVQQLASFERLAAECVDEVERRAARTASTWAGAAAGEFSAAQAGWVRDARELHAALGILCRIVAKAHGNYAEAVSANRAMWP